MNATPIQSPKELSAFPPPVSVFDMTSAILKTPAGGVINVPAGTNLVRCDGTVVVQPGVTVRGVGPSSIVRRDTNPAYTDGNQPVLLCLGDNIVVEDLTLDANGTDGDIYAHSCLTIQGRNPTVRNVVGIRPSGQWGRVECFAFFICPPAGIPSSGGIISQCRLEHVKGNYVEGFCVWGGCKVRDCHVEYPVLPSSATPPWFGGYQVAYSYGASITGCSQVGGTAFLYTDTGSDIDLRIQGCTAINVTRGIIIVRAAGQILEGALFRDNVFELSINALSNDGANGIAISGPGESRNVRIVDNLIRHTAGASGPPGNGIIAAGVVTDTRSGSIIAGNQHDADFLILAEPSAIITGNTVAAQAPSTQ